MGFRPSNKIRVRIKVAFLCWSLFDSSTAASGGIGMAHRQIGQEQLSLSKAKHKSSLDELASVIDWTPVSALLGLVCPLKSDPS